MENYVVDYDTDVNPLYIRAKTSDRNSAVRAVENAVGSVELLSFAGASQDEIAFVTKKDEERKLVAALKNVSEIEIESFIRITDY